MRQQDKTNYSVIWHRTQHLHFKLQIVQQLNQNFSLSSICLFFGCVSVSLCVSLSVFSFKEASYLTLELETRDQQSKPTEVCSLTEACYAVYDGLRHILCNSQDMIE